MQPADIGRLVTPGTPRVAPDGTRVAVVVTRVDLEADRYRSAVWLVPADGSSPARPLTAGEDTDAPSPSAPCPTSRTPTSRWWTRCISSTSTASTPASCGR